MKISTIQEELNSLAYHGRGIVIGKSADGKKAVTAYFIMGRSVNSRNRVFVAEGENMRTKAFDESKNPCKSRFFSPWASLLGRAGHHGWSCNR